MMFRNNHELYCEPISLSEMVAVYPPALQSLFWQQENDSWQQKDRAECAPDGSEGLHPTESPESPRVPPGAATGSNGSIVCATTDFTNDFLTELDPGQAHSPTGSTADSLALEKEAWFNSVQLTWGQCGYSMRRTSDDRPVATVVFAPPRFCPRTFHMPSGPVSPDAVLLTSLHYDPFEVDESIQAMLIGTVFRHLSSRGVHAVEAYGCSGTGDSSAAVELFTQDQIILNEETVLASSLSDEIGDLSGLTSGLHCKDETVSGISHAAGDLIKTRTLIRCGMSVVKPHPVHPKLRIELDAELDWDEAVGQALDRHVAAQYYAAMKANQSSFSASRS